MPVADLKRVVLAVSSYGSYGRRIIEGVTDYGDRHGRWEFEHIRPDAVRGRVRSGRAFAGMIAEAASDRDRKMLGRVDAAVVAVTGPAEARHVPFVGGDNAAIGRIAADYFLDRGFARLAFASAHDREYSRERSAAFADAIDAAGAERHDFHAWLRQASDTDPATALMRWLGELPKPIAVFTATDIDAVEVINACREADLAVPESVAVLGVDDDELRCRLATPPLSSIDHGTRRMGFEAAALLDRLLDGHPAPTEPIVVPPVGVIERQSTDTLAIEDADVAAAVRYIRTHAIDGIGVADIIAAVPTARRTLEVKFHRYLGRTLREELVRHRVDRARHLLVTTDMTGPQIADAVGFRYASQFSSVFKRETGHTPTDYRRTHSR